MTAQTDTNMENEKPENTQPDKPSKDTQPQNPQPVVVNIVQEQQEPITPKQEKPLPPTGPQDSPQNLKPPVVPSQTIYSNPFVIRGMENRKELPPYTDTDLDPTQDISQDLLTHEVVPSSQETLGNKQYRLSVGGGLSPFYVETKGLNYALIDLYTSFGWVIGSFELGPFILADLKLRLESAFSDFQVFDVTGGGFFEYNFHSYQESRRFYSSIGLQLGYNRFLRKNYIFGRPYFSLKLFLSPQSALNWELGFTTKITLNNQKSYGPDLLFGFMHYFH